MILYLDTSALIKLYLDEPDSELAHQRIEQASKAATSWLAYPESRSALARHLISHPDYSEILRDFESDWNRYIRIEPTDSLLRRAGDIAEKHRLTGFDAVHLASALHLAEYENVSVIFWAADRKLASAARKEGLPDPSEEHLTK